MTKQAPKRGGASREPKIGIFWVIKGKVVGLAIPMTEVEPFGDFVDVDVAHADYWEGKKTQWGHPYEEYFEVPRGRVLFSVKEKVFRIISSSKILGNQRLLEKINGFFCLNAQKTTIMQDLHYEDPSFVDIFNYDHEEEKE